MEPRIRPATLADVDALLGLKRALMIAPGADLLSRGGFLLGSSREQYADFIARANVLLLEASDRLLGFAVTLPDPVLRQSELWARAEHIRWTDADPPDAGPNLLEILASRVGYFEQLAFLPAANLRIYAPAFALAAALDLAASDHRHIFMTVVSAPVANLAPLPFLRIIGARRLGSIAEEYPDVGAITSDIYHLDTQRWNYSIGPDNPLYRLRQRVAHTVAMLRRTLR